MNTTKLANTIVGACVILVIVAFIWMWSVIRYHEVKHVMTPPAIETPDTIKLQPIVTYTDTTYYQVIYEDVWGKVMVLSNTKDVDL